MAARVGTVPFQSTFFWIVVSFSILFMSLPASSATASIALGQSLAKPPSALVAALQSTPFEERSAILVSPKEGAPIALYIRPAPNQQPVGYGVSGDPVTITDQFGDYLMGDDPRATWSHIRLDNPPYTEGWLRGRFLSADAVDMERSVDDLNGG